MTIERTALPGAGVRPAVRPADAVVVVVGGRPGAAAPTGLFTGGEAGAP